MKNSKSSARLSFIFESWIKRDLLIRVLNFALVGCLTSAGYVILVAGLINPIGLPDELAASIAYFFMLPLNFWGHKYFTFKSNLSSLLTSFRFILMHAMTALLCTVIMWISTEKFDTSHWFGSFLIVLIAPLFNYTVMARWVFLNRDV